MPRKKLLGVGIIAGALFVGTAAHAGTSYTGFDVVAPRFQQGVDTAFQTKSGPLNKASQAKVNSIGPGYKVNLRTVRSGPKQHGTEKKGLGTGTHSLNSPFAAGARVGLNIHNSVWATVNLQVTGAFRTN